MAYNKKNKLRLMIDIQDIYRKYSQHHSGSATDAWIFRNLIEPKYHITLKTFQKYISHPARRELSEILEQEQTQTQTA